MATQTLTKRPKLDPSHYDFSQVSWHMVLDKAGVSKLEEIEKLVEKYDAEELNLRCLLEGKDWAAAAVSKFGIPEQDLQKILSLVPSLDVPTKREVWSTLFLSSRPRLHVGLQLKLFGEFIDAKNTDPPHPKYYTYAAKVMLKMTSSCDSRHNAFFDVMKFCIMPSGISKNHATISKNGIPLVYFEFISKCPDVDQYMAAFVNFKAAAGEGHLSRYPRSPVLIVSIIGTRFLQVFGGLWNESMVCVDPLTPPLSLLWTPRDPLSCATDLARALAAIDAAIPKLCAYYNSPQSYPDEGPYHLREKIEYQGYLSSYIPWTIPCLFSAKMDDKDVCVKFVSHRYGEDVHRYLAAHNLAPQLISEVELLPGGWRAVVMEKIDGVMIDYVDTKVVASLKKVLQLMAEKNFVHGDLRPCNIIIANDQVYVIDFDWAGIENEVRYPLELEITTQWADGVQPGGLIRKEHDEYQINQIIPHDW